MKDYDIFNFGNFSVDIIKTPVEEYSMIGGSVLYAVWAAHQLGKSVGVLTKTSLESKSFLDEFPKDNVDKFWIESKKTTSIKNNYQTASKETRICTNLGQADSYKIEDFPEFTANVIQYSGLLTGEINSKIIRFLSNIAPLAIDVQGLTRTVFPDGSMEFTEWEDMNNMLPFITYFKADAAEAKFLTDIDTSNHDGRVKAAKWFVDHGVKEVVISHNQEMIAASKAEVKFAPFRNKSLKGRTGRGDTSFTTYIAERMNKNQQDSITYSAALTSIKMEIPGPFKKTRKEIQEFIKLNY